MSERSSGSGLLATDAFGCPDKRPVAVRVSCLFDDEDADEKAEETAKSRHTEMARVRAVPLNNQVAPGSRQGPESRVIRNDLTKSAGVRFASGAPIVQAAVPALARALPIVRVPSAAEGVSVVRGAPCCSGGSCCSLRITLVPISEAASDSDAVHVDLSELKGVRAEVTFSGAGEPDTSATRQNEKEAQLHLVRLRQQFVQVQQPLCLPRSADRLGSWRTCMVPLHFLEQFAYMKPPCRKWQHLANPTGGGGSGAASGIVFSLMTYNVLSDHYTSASNFWYCPAWALDWSFRRQGILENICGLMPTVLCLQEVETEQYYSFFLPHLTKRGYDGIFTPKSRAKTMDDRLRKRVDGCAVFWKRSEFRLVQERVIEFNQRYLEQCHTHCRVSSEIFNRVWVRDNIALAALLAPVSERASASRLLVCTSHIHWDPQFSDVKLIQTMMLTSALAGIAAEHEQPLPVILCGDFNSLPESGVVEFLRQGSVPRDHPEFQCLGKDPSLDGLNVTPTSQSFWHSLDLVSCYDSAKLGYTNYTHDFKGVIDHIFASRTHFRLLDTLDGLTDWFRAERVLGCPHPYVPSDHIPLMIRLELQLPGLCKST